MKQSRSRVVNDIGSERDPCIPVPPKLTRNRIIRKCITTFLIIFFFNLKENATNF